MHKKWVGWDLICVSFDSWRTSDGMVMGWLSLLGLFLSLKIFTSIVWGIVKHGMKDGVGWGGTLHGLGLPGSFSHLMRLGETIEFTLPACGWI